MPARLRKIDVPRRVFLMGFLTDTKQAEKDREQIEKLCLAHAISPPAQKCQLPFYDHWQMELSLRNNIMSSPPIAGMFMMMARMREQNYYLN